MRSVVVLALGAAMLAGSASLAGCGNGAGQWFAPGSTPPVDAATIEAPHDGATGVPASQEIVYAVPHGDHATVTLTDPSGASVSGQSRPDGSSWVPDHQLSYNTRYAATVSAGGTTASVTFTTMQQPTSTNHVRSNIGDDQVVGVAAPFVLTFTHPVPDSARAAVQSRLFLTTTPSQQGAWNWFSATEVHFRPKVFWQTGTKLALRALIGGLPMGDGRYGDADLTVDASAAPHAISITIDDTTKQLTVSQDGTVLKSIPASLGKATTPTSSGNMVIISSNPSVIFDSSTYGVPVNSPNGYRERVAYAMRLTWDGQFIHAAPWSIGSQGRYDVSHGCTNISLADAKWLYGLVHVGDPVTVEHTGSPLKWGDGWTDWNVSFAEYVKGSALPVR